MLLTLERLNIVALRPFLEKTFLVEVPIILTYNMDLVDVIGVPVDRYGKPDIHRNKTVKYDIYSMLNVYNDGYPIKLVNKDDVHEIFNIIGDVINTLENMFMGGIKATHPKIQEVHGIAIGFSNEILANNKKSLEYKINKDGEFKSSLSMGKMKNPKIRKNIQTINPRGTNDNR